MSFLFLYIRIVHIIFAPRLAPCYRYVATIQFSKKRRSKVDYGTIARFSTVVPQDSVLRSMRGAVRVRTDKHCSNSKCDRSPEVTESVASRPLGIETTFKAIRLVLEAISISYNGIF